MSLDHFRHLVRVIRYYDDETKKNKCVLEKLNNITKSAKVKNVIINDFSDVYCNFKKWLDGEPCCLKHPVTKQSNL